MPTVSELRQRFADERRQRASALPLPHLQPGKVSIAPLGPKPPPLPESSRRHGRRFLAVNNHAKKYQSSLVGSAPNAQGQAPAEGTSSSHDAITLPKQYSRLGISLQGPSHAAEGDELDDDSNVDADVTTAHIEVEVDVEIVDVTRGLDNRAATQSTLDVVTLKDSTRRTSSSRATKSPGISARAHELRAAEIKALMAARHYQSELGGHHHTAAQHEKNQANCGAVADPEPEDAISNHNHISNNDHLLSKHDGVQDGGESDCDVASTTSDASNESAESTSDDVRDSREDQDVDDDDTDGRSDASDSDGSSCDGSSSRSDYEDDRDDALFTVHEGTNEDSESESESQEDEEDEEEDGRRVVEPTFVPGPAPVAQKKSVKSKAKTKTKKKDVHKSLPRRRRDAVPQSKTERTMNAKSTRDHQPGHEQDRQRDDAKHDSSSRKRRRRASVPYKRRRKDSTISDYSSSTVPDVELAYKTSWVLQALKFMLPPILLLPVFFVIRCFIVIPLRACWHAVTASTHSMLGPLMRVALRAGRGVRRMMRLSNARMCSLVDRMLCRKPRKGKRKLSFGRLVLRELAAFGRYTGATFKWVVFSPCRVKAALVRRGRETRRFVRENWEEVLDVLAALFGLSVITSIFLFVVVPVLVWCGLLSFWSLHLFGLGKFYAAIGVVDGPNLLLRLFYRV